MILTWYHSTLWITGRTSQSRRRWALMPLSRWHSSWLITGEKCLLLHRYIVMKRFTSMFQHLWMARTVTSFCLFIAIHKFTIYMYSTGKITGASFLSFMWIPMFFPDYCPFALIFLLICSPLITYLCTFWNILLISEGVAIVWIQIHVHITIFLFSLLVSSVYLQVQVWHFFPATSLALEQKHVLKAILLCVQNVRQKCADLRERVTAAVPTWPNRDDPLGNGGVGPVLPCGAQQRRVHGGESQPAEGRHLQPQDLHWLGGCCSSLDLKDFG